MAEKPNYNAWSHEDLITRVTALEAELKLKINSSSHQSTSSFLPTQKPSRTERVFNPGRYSTRLVALKLAYLGKKYCGFEYTGTNTPVPTIEEELWKALNKARLVFPQGVNPVEPGPPNWEGCEYSKCGRTDRGVSAFGQVVGIRVRSKRPLGKKRMKQENDKVERNEEERSVEQPENLYNTFPREGALEVMAPPLSPFEDENKSSETLDLSNPDLTDSLNFDPIADELPYPQLLNRLLPPDIRILAWCPAPPLDFSARFSCRERRYKYFFTQPAFAPIPHQLEQPWPASTPKTVMKDGWLNIEAMRKAAKQFEGLHDFRNFCKVDAKKQISNFERRIFYADIEEVPDYTSSLAYVDQPGFLSLASGTEEGLVKKDNPKVYTFILHGSAFLWHQVRHMVAVLFLVGQGLEPPSIVSDLLDIGKTTCRPVYEMATDGPLVLWDCIFPHEEDEERKDALQWHYIGKPPDIGDVRFGNGGLMEDLWKSWREKKIDELLAGSLLGLVAQQGARETWNKDPKEGRKGKSQKVFDGSSGVRAQGKYVPVMEKERLERVEVLNKKWAVKMGFESSEAMKEQGFRRLKREKEGVVVVDEGVE